MNQTKINKSDRIFTTKDTRCFARVLTPTTNPSAPTIILLHGGFGFDHSYFLPHVEDLAKHYQLICLDLRGHGQSDELPPSGFDFDRINQDLEAIRQELGLEEWAVLGHSGGGLVAAHYAAAFSKHVSHLLFVGSFPEMPFDAHEFYDLARQLHDPGILHGFHMFKEGIKNDTEYKKAVLHISPLFFADPKNFDPTPFEQISFRYAPMQDALTRYNHINTGQELLNFTKPTLIIHGDQDHRVPLIEASRLKKCVPHAELAIIPQTGHYPFIEAPQEFCRIVKDFLNGTHFFRATF